MVEGTEGMEYLIVGAIGTIGVSMATAITYMFKTIMKESKNRRLESEKLYQRLGTMEGRHKGVENLSKKTLQVVHDAITEREEYET
jgi:hypothetical protein